MATDFAEDFIRIWEAVANGRHASPAKSPKVTIEECIRRGSSLVRVNGRMYHVRVTEVEETR